MQTSHDYLNVLTTILAVGTGVVPIMFGFLLWKLSQHFVSVGQFEEYKRTAAAERIEMKERLGHIEANTVKLLERTAKLSVDRVKEN